MTVTALLFCYRLPTLTQDAFREYIESTHVPLVQSLLGSKHPLTHTRYYINKDQDPSSGRGFMVGSATNSDADLIAVITFESPEAMQASMTARQADGVREVIETDEEKFMDRSRVRLVVLGGEDVGRSVREG